MSHLYAVFKNLTKPKNVFHSNITLENGLALQLCKSNTFNEMKYMSDSNKMIRISSKISQAKREAFYII